jgi:hypothetical protein
MNERIDKEELHARCIVKIMVQHFLSGTANKQLREQFEKETGFKKQTFLDGLAYATTVRQWIVSSGEKKRKRYNLNANGCWKDAVIEPDDRSVLVGLSVPSLRGNGPTRPTDQSADQSNGLKTDQKQTNGPTADSKNKDATGLAEKSTEINETESSKKTKEILRKIIEREAAAGDTTAQAALQRNSVLKMTSEAIQHADKKKTNG